MAITPEDAIRDKRRESQRAIAQIFRALGYPEEWSSVVEQRVYDRGRVWTSRPTK